MWKFGRCAQRRGGTEDSDRCVFIRCGWKVRGELAGTCEGLAQKVEPFQPKSVRATSAVTDGVESATRVINFNPPACEQGRTRGAGTRRRMQRHVTVWAVIHDTHH